MTLRKMENGRPLETPDSNTENNGMVLGDAQLRKDLQLKRVKN